MFKVSRIQIVSALLGLALVAGIAALALSATSSPAPVWAASGGSGVEIIFTKGVTAAPGYPMMAGVGGGDAGPGSFAGEILHRDPTLGNGRLTQLEALYEIKGVNHSFKAQGHVMADNQKGTAVITGVVTEGWLQGALVYGRYTVIRCSETNALNGNCFQGTLRIAEGHSE